MNFNEYMTSEKEISRQIANTVLHFPLLSKHLDRKVIEDSIRRKFKYKNDLAFIPVTDKEIAWKLLECFFNLNNCQNFEKKAMSFNNFNTISPVLIELEFASLLPNSLLNFSFPPFFPFLRF